MEGKSKEIYRSKAQQINTIFLSNLSICQFHDNIGKYGKRMDRIENSRIEKTFRKKFFFEMFPEN